MQMSNRLEYISGQYGNRMIQTFVLDVVACNRFSKHFSLNLHEISRVLLFLTSYLGTFRIRTNIE